jgi:hypothetical protein
VRTKKEIVKMVLGENMGMESIKIPMEKVLIGHFMGKQVLEGPMRR